MVWFVVMHLFSTLVDWVKMGRLADQAKDLEICEEKQYIWV